MFAHTLANFGNQPALLLEDGSSVSYSALADSADALFSAGNIPVPAGSLIAIESVNDADTVAAYLGALRHGYPVLLVDRALHETLRQRLYTHYQVSCCRRDGQWMHLSAHSPVLHKDIALLLSTSGSTGSPKLVSLGLANLEANARAIRDYLHLTPDERPVTVLPLHYSYGLSVLNSHLASGSTILLTRQPVTSRPFWDAVRQHAATSLSGVPTTYNLLRQMRFERMTLPSIRTLTQAGGHLPEPLRVWLGDLCKMRNWECVIMYGQTEATARMAYLPPQHIADKPGAIGIAIPGGSFTLKDDAGNTITAARQPGQLHYAGPNVMLGYILSADDLSLGDQQHGQLDTGDIAWRDEDGFYYISGRRSRFIKVFGNRLSLDEIEHQLQNEGYQVAATGVDDKLMVALVSQHDPDALLQLLLTRYHLHRSACQVTKLDQLPMSSSGKIQYAALLHLLSQPTATGPA